MVEVTEKQAQALVGKAYCNNKEPDERAQKYNDAINKHNLSWLMGRKKRRKDTQKEQHALSIKGVR